MAMTPQQAFQRAYGASVQYTEDSLNGLGALKGANCQMSANKVDKDTSLTFTWLDKDDVEHKTETVIRDGDDIDEIVRQGEKVILKMTDGTTKEFILKNLKVSEKENTEYSYKVQFDYVDENGNDQAIVSPNLKQKIDIKEDGDNNEYSYKLDIDTYDDKGQVQSRIKTVEMLPPRFWYGNDVKVEYIDEEQTHIKSQIVDIPNSKKGDFYINTETSFVFQRTDSLGVANTWEFSHNSRGKGNFEIAKECGFAGDKFEWYASLLINKWQYDKPTKETIEERDLNKIIFYMEDTDKGLAWDVRIDNNEDVVTGTYYFYDGSQYIKFSVPKDIPFETGEYTYYFAYNEKFKTFNCYKTSTGETKETTIVFEGTCEISENKPTDATEFIPTSAQRLGKPMMTCFVGDSIETAKGFDFASLTQDSSGGNQFAPSYPKLNEDGTKLLLRFVGSSVEVKAPLYNEKTTPYFKGSTADRLAFAQDEVWKLREFIWFDTTLHCQMLYRKDAGYMQYRGQQVKTNAPENPTEGTIWHGYETIYRWDDISEYWKIVLQDWDFVFDFSTPIPFGNIVISSLNYEDGFILSATALTEDNGEIVTTAVSDGSTGGSAKDTLFVVKGTGFSITPVIKDGITYSISISQEISGDVFSCSFVRYGDKFYANSISRHHQRSNYFKLVTTDRNEVKTLFQEGDIVYDTRLRLELVYRDGCFAQKVDGETDTFPSDTSADFKSSVTGITYAWDESKAYWYVKDGNTVWQLFDSIHPVGQTILASVPPTLGTWVEITSNTERALMIGSNKTFGDTIGQALPKPSISCSSSGSHSHSYGRISNTYSRVKIDADTNWGYTGQWSSGTTGSAGSHSHTVSVSTSGAYGTGSKVLMDGYFVKLWKRTA